MCESQPFYFDEQFAKLNHRVKELYRFRAYAIDFAVERNQGLPSILFHLGLKQSLKTTNFFLFPKNYSFRKTYFSREYAYLLWSTPSKNISIQESKRDWFSSDIEAHNFSFFLWESFFRKDQRRFWRSRLKGLWNRHLRLENLFSISVLNSGPSLDADIPYDGADSSSYHFSFLSNSLDRRSLALSPVRLFHFKYKRFLSWNLYQFSLRLNFRRQFFPIPSFFASKLYGYIRSHFFEALFFLFYYYMLFLNPSTPLLPSWISYIKRPLGLSVVSALNFHSRTQYYFLPEGLLSSFPKSNYRRDSVFLTFHHHLLSLYKPWTNFPAFRNSLGVRPGLRVRPKSKRLSRSLQRSLFLLRRRWYRRRRDKPHLLGRLWLTRLLKLRLIHRLRRKFFLLFVSNLLQPGSNFFSSSKNKFLFIRKLPSFWRFFSKKANFFRFQWGLFLKRSLWKSRKLQRLPLFFKWKHALQKSSINKRSPASLEAKFFLHKFFLLFLSLQKSSFFLPLENPFPSFLRLMQAQLKGQLTWSSSLKNYSLHSRLAQRLKALENYRGKILSSWIFRWKYLAKRFFLLQNIFKQGGLSMRWQRRYSLLWKRILRLRYKLWRALSRISYLAYSWRYYSYSLRLSSVKRKQFSLLKTIKNNIAPSQKLKKSKLLRKSKSSKRRHWFLARFHFRAKRRWRSRRRRRLMRSLFITRRHLKWLLRQRRKRKLIQRLYNYFLKLDQRKSLKSNASIL